MQDDILSCAQAESKAFDYIRKNLGHGSSLTQHVIDLYDTLQEAGKGDNSRAYVLTLLTVHCSHSLIAGVLALWRGHTGYAKNHLRASIEGCLFALNLYERPSSADAWLGLAENYEKYRDEFKIMRLLDPAKYKTLTDLEKPVLETLLGRYEQCCLQVHTSMMAIMPGMDSSEPNIHFIDSVPVNQIVTEYWWALDSHLQICKLLAVRFEQDNRSFKRKEWLDSWKKVDQLLIDFMRIRRPHEYLDHIETPEELQGFWETRKK